MTSQQDSSSNSVAKCSFPTLVNNLHVLMKKQTVLQTPPEIHYNF